MQKYVPDQQTLFAQFQTGEVDVYDIQGIPPLLYQRAKALPGSKIVLNANPFVEFIYFNCGKPQFQDKRVRKALYMAVDRKGWIDAVYYGVPVPTLSYLPPNHWAYNKALVDPGYDPKKAAALLDEAGWKVAADGVRAKDGVRLAFTMSTTAGNKSREQAQQLVQQNLKKINVEMTIKNMPASVVWGDYTVQSQFDTLMVGWDALLYPDPGLWRPHPLAPLIPAKGGSGSNYVQYQNPEIDELCAKGVATTNLEERKAIYDKIQAILLDDLPFAPIFSYQSDRRRKDRMNGYEVNPIPDLELVEHGGLDDGLSRRRGPLPVNRLARSAVLLVGVSVIGFALMHLAPGGPLAMYTLNPTVTAQDIERIKVQFGLDQPVWVQYFKWAAGVFTGNWGYSFFGGQPVREVVFDRLPATFELMGSALCLSLLIGVAIGVLGGGEAWLASRPCDGGRGDGGAVAADLLVRPARDLHFRADSGLAAGGRNRSTDGGGFLDALRHLILPVAVLALVLVAQWSRYTRSSCSRSSIRTSSARRGPRGCGRAASSSIMRCGRRSCR